MSDQRIEDIQVRRLLRLEYLSKNPRCQARLQGCWGAAHEVHEVINRSQRSTSWLEPDKFVGLCSSCHGWVTTHPTWANGHGYTLLQGQHHELEAAREARSACHDRGCAEHHLAV